MQHFSYWGGKIEHISLCRHCIQTFAAAKVHKIFDMSKRKGKKKIDRGARQGAHPPKQQNHETAPQVLAEREG